MMQDSSDTRTSEQPARSSFDELRDLAGAWSSPVELFKRLQHLMTEKPLLALGAAVVIGGVVGGRLARRRPHAT